MTRAWAPGPSVLGGGVGEGPLAWALLLMPGGALVDPCRSLLQPGTSDRAPWLQSP